MSTSQKISMAMGNVTAVISVLVVNALSAILPINGKTPGELSDLYVNLFVPSGLTFAIWGVIYLQLAAFVIYQFMLALKGDEKQVLKDISYWFILSSIFNIGWIFAWHYELMIVSILAMLGLLASLIVLYQRLGIGQGRGDNSRKSCIHATFSVYLGWISVATIANITAALVKYQWTGWGISQQVWTIVMVSIAAILGLVFLFIHNDIFYTLVVDWALIGIYLKRSVIDTTPLTTLLGVTAGCITVLSLGVILQIIRRKVYTPPAR